MSVSANSDVVEREYIQSCIDNAYEYECDDNQMDALDAKLYNLDQKIKDTPKTLEEAIDTILDKHMEDDDDLKFLKHHLVKGLAEFIAKRYLPR